MAQDFSNRYPGRWDPSDSSNPMGVAKNRSAEGAFDGTYMEKDIFQTLANTVGAVLAEAGLTPNGDVDVAGNSQFVDAINSIIDSGVNSSRATDQNALDGLTSGVLSAEQLKLAMEQFGQFGYAKNLPSDTSLNQYFEAGLYNCINFADSPISGWCSLSVDRHSQSGQYLIQRLSTLTGSEKNFYIRTIFSGDFSETWKKDWNEYTLPIPTEAQAQDHDSTTPYAWTPQRVAQAIDIATDLRDVGKIIFVPAISAPSGYLKANGVSLSRTTYAKLWVYAQNSGNLVDQSEKDTGNFGTGNGSTTFTIPDLRGEFIRGWDDGRGIDTGRVVGSWQEHELLSHTHLEYVNGDGYGTGRRATGTDDVAGTHATNPKCFTGETGGDETRPRNVALLACIKYQEQ